MKRFKNWLRDWLFNDGPILNSTRPGKITTLSKGPEIRESFNFSVTVAQGGVVLSIRRYDRNRDESKENVYVLHDDDDIAQNIGNIINMEMLRG